MKRSHAFATIALVAACVWAPGNAAALFADPGAVSANSFSAAVLEAPTGVSGSAGCVGSSAEVSLGWDASSSTFADGYEIRRSDSPGGPYTVVGTTSDRFDTSLADTVAPAAFYYYVVRTTGAGWESTDSSEEEVVTPPMCP
jgi:hypothetical protein